MSLKKYQSMRKFDETSEPKGKSKKQGSGNLRFCVQRHSARRLHYDLRFELDGVLVSFAVPKGPSMDPKDKRLAIHVEDHPLDYISFEGEIPPGNYGAGTVEIWDQGVYLAKAADMRAGLKKGHIHVVFEGKKLTGAFNLIRMHTQEEKDQWLLCKVADIETAPKKVAKKKPMPQWISPMLASIAEQAFDDPDWLFEIKWNGYRAMAFVNDSKVELFSRNHNSFNQSYRAIVKELKKLQIQAIFDGEIVALDEQGISRFELLQNHHHEAKVLHYAIFDLLYANEQDLRALPLVQRKELLHDLLTTKKSPLLLYSDYVEEKGVRFFAEAKKQGLEGIMAKKKDSAYVSLRTNDWLKIKSSQRQEFVIAGFTAPRQGRSYFGSLLLGVYKNEGLSFAGHVGTGFDQASLESIYKKMKPLMRKTCPFKHIPSTNEKATWLKPTMLAEISFTEWTSLGSLRHPVFHGLRNDKAASSVIREKVPKAELSEYSNLDKIFYKEEGYTKADVLTYYQTIAPVILPHLLDRPLTLHRYPDGIDGADFYQKNMTHPPDFLATATIEHTVAKKKKLDRYAMINDERSLLYVVNLASIEIHPMLAQASNLSCPTFMVLDLDPEDIAFSAVIEVARHAHELCNELGLASFCKTSGGRGLHIYIPLGKNNLTYEQSLHLAELLAHILRNQLPDIISLERMPKKRQKRVYVDYLQNGTHKTTVAPYSLRAKPHAPVSTPLRWQEVKAGLDPLDFTIITIPKRVQKLSDIFGPLLEASINLKKTLKRIERLQDF